jgi:DNA-binding transcriptional LysR family regulator
MPVDVTLLRHFVAVAEQLHFTRAAKALGISRQALSSSVRQLEADRGVELFDRSHEGTHLSAEGEALLAEAPPLIEAEDARLAALDAAAALPATLSLAFVPGVTVGKWTTAWEERYPGVSLRVRPGTEAEAISVLRDGIADLSFVRLPVKGHGLSIIPLYTETAVIVASKDHPIAAFDELTLADIAGENVVVNPDSVGDAVELVAAGVGLVRVPQAIARLHARKDVVARPLVDAPTTEIALVWIDEDLTPDMEEFVGIVRGRTAASSRSPRAGSGNAPAHEKTAQAKPAQSPAAKKPKTPAAKAPKPQVKHSREALQARNRRRGSGR